MVGAENGIVQVEVTNEGGQLNVWAINDWNRIYENNRTRALKRLDWVPIPNKMDGDGYTHLMNHDHGEAHFGVWIALVEIASKSENRGLLQRRISTDGQPIWHDSASIARVSRMRVPVIEEAIPRLVEIGWLIEVTVRDFINMHDPAGIAHVPAGIQQEGASVRARVRTERNGTEGNGRERNGTERNGSAPEQLSNETGQLKAPAKRSSSFPSLEIPKAVQNALLTTERIDWMRQALQGYMQRDGSVYLPKPPDDDIILRCLNAVGDTDLETIGDTLKTLRSNGQAPGKPGGPEAYTWFPKVLENIFQADAAQS